MLLLNKEVQQLEQIFFFVVRRCFSQSSTYRESQLLSNQLIYYSWEAGRRCRTLWGAE